MIRYTDSTKNITSEMLKGFFQGWKKPHTPEDHLKILENSDYVVLAVDTDTHRVVGFITALTDKVQSAFISLLEVLPDYRKQGIGTALVSKMLEKLKGIPAIDLICDAELQKFYYKFGMSPSVGMVIRNFREK
jgi:ribosomal protein S18 acetylase RimI-like enzyme